MQFNFTKLLLYYTQSGLIVYFNTAKINSSTGKFREQGLVIGLHTTSLRM